MSGRLTQQRIVDPVLTNIARGYSNTEFVAQHLFPIVNVVKEAGKIPTFGKEAFYIYQTERAIRANSNKLPVEARSSVDFALVEHDAVYPLDYRELAEDIIDLQSFGATMAQAAIELKLEYAAAVIATTAGNFPSGNKVTLTSTDQFTHADCNPFTLVDTGKEAVRTKIGKRPNVGIMGAVSFKALRNNALILDRIKYTQKGIVTAELLASLFELDALYIGSAVYQTDAGVMTDVWGDNFVMAYVPGVQAGQNRSMYEPAFGYTLRKSGMPEVDSYEEDGGKILNIRSTDNLLVKIVGSDAGYLMDDTNG